MFSFSSLHRLLVTPLSFISVDSTDRNININININFNININVGYILQYQYWYWTIYDANKGVNNISVDLMNCKRKTDTYFMAN